MNSTGYYNVNSWNWYETNNYEYIYEEWFNLNPGQYCVNATLWDVSNGAMNYVDVEYPCFTITASNNGGGNNVVVIIQTILVEMTHRLLI